MCQQLGDIGLIQWKPLSGGEGVVAGMARITGKGVGAVEAGRSPEIDIKFPNRAAGDGQQEWISAQAALALVKSSRAICNRAHVGLVKARAARFIYAGKSSDNVDVPTEMWWAKGEAALTQDWKSGDFETWIRNTIQLQAFAVTFNRADIEKMLPHQRVEEVGKTQMKPAVGNVFIGHGRSQAWLILDVF